MTQRITFDNDGGIYGDGEWIANWQDIVGEIEIIEKDLEFYSDSTIDGLIEHIAFTSQRNRNRAAAE